MSDLHEWAIPVFVSNANWPYKIHRISGTRDAAHFMTCEWSGLRGESYEKALWVCGLVVSGILNAEYARSAFVLAAQDITIPRSQQSRESVSHLTADVVIAFA